jgi:tRNA1(Val) A37 N6-methylase TrmN6
MKRHETPRDIAVALSRHAPKRIRSLLDPSVGTGNLLEPLFGRLQRAESRVCCVDSDPDAIRHVKETMGSRLPLDTCLVAADFLDWSRRHGSLRFDCVVMNPPFAGKKADWCPIVTRGVGGVGKLRYAPLEAAFVRTAIDLLVDTGRLLAVLPSSIVMSDSLQWLRDEMIASGAIRLVHELPPRSFSGVEARMYLMVFDKGGRQTRITLLNHDLHNPEKLSLACADGQLERLDFGFVRGRESLAELVRDDSLGWSKLGNVAALLRGDIDSPEGPKVAVHSSDFSSGFWVASDRHDRSVVKSHSRKVQRGDLLISRVGRDASRSIGRGLGIAGMSCSDCVFVIRPFAWQYSLKLLFALRFVLSHDWSQALLERGTGARYISQQSLCGLLIPCDLYRRYPDQFRTFFAAERSRNSDRSRAAVDSVVERFSRDRR